MISKYYQPSLEIYRVLLSFLKTTELVRPLELSEDNSTNFLLVEAYINAHMDDNALTALKRTRFFSDAFLDNMTTGELFALLSPSGNFARCGAAYILNLAKLRRLSPRPP